MATPRELVPYDPFDVSDGSASVSLPYVMVDGLGADGVTNAATIQSYIDAYESLIAAGSITGAHLVLPGFGESIPLTGGVTINQNRIHITGQGSWATRITFIPTAHDQICFDFRHATALAILYQCSLRGVSITSSDTTYRKIGVRCFDTSGFTLQDVAVGPIGGWTTAGTKDSIGLLTLGRDKFVIDTNNNLAADKPIVLRANPNYTSIDFDVSSIRGNLLIANGNPNITIEDGVLLTNASFVDNSMNLGTHGIHYRDTGALNQSYAIRVEGNRWEQAESAGWLFYCERTANSILSVSVIGNHTGGPTGEGGFYLRNVTDAFVAGNSLVGPGVALNCDSTVGRLVSAGNFWTSVATFAITGMTRSVGVSGGPAAGTPGAAFEVWTSTSDPFVDSKSFMLQAGTGTASYKPGGVILATTNVGLATTASATPQTLWSDTLVGGTLASDGKEISVDIVGVAAANANAKTLRFVFGATAVVLNPTTASPQGTWRAQIVVLRASATLQYILCDVWIGGTRQAIALAAANETLANDIAMSFTAEPSVAVADEVTRYRAKVRFE